mmetsp:Transcript_37631/g.93173  ORF Transcript_37631/g.93173 Transcript_37631/m.93173 type:complete len:261 (+) Transcript_37631:1024-1806(+)
MAPMLAQDRRLPARFRTTETPAVKKAPVASKQARAPICAVDLGPSPWVEGDDPVNVVSDDDGSSDGGSSEDNEEKLDALSNDLEDPEEDESEGDHTSELHVRVHTPGNSDASSPGDAPPRRRPFQDQMAASTRVFLFDGDGARVWPMYLQEGDVDTDDEVISSPVPIAAEGLSTHFVSVDVATTGNNIADDKVIRLAVNVRDENGETVYEGAENFSNGNIAIRSSGLCAPFGIAASDLVGLPDFDERVGYFLDINEEFLR